MTISSRGGLSPEREVVNDSQTLENRFKKTIHGELVDS